MKKFIEEFKKFALRGNMMDMAIGVIIGGAFSGIVTSFIDNFINPILNFVMAGARYSGSEIGTYCSAFLSSIVNFFFMALVLFILVKAINKLMAIGQKKETPAPTTKECPYCRSKIDIKATRCPHCTSQLPEK